MKSFYIGFIAILSLLCISTTSQANTVIVSGYVNFTNGLPAANWPVTIMPDSNTSSAGCYQSHVKYTNPNGYYRDTLYCTGSITKVMVWTTDCNGNYVIQNPQVPANNNVVSNFSICPSHSTCNAEFSYSATSLNASFNSTGSHAASGSSVIERIWNFGDSTPTLGGNQIYPNHNYANAGSYTVKLIVVAGNGCRDTAVKSVTVYANNTLCQAYFYDTVNSNQTALFFSGNSSTSPGDSIIGRHWTFGDGTGLQGNVVNPDHHYNTNGTFLACLKIYSSRGCTDSICKIVTITGIPNPVVCNASFSDTAIGNKGYFYSGSSTTGAGDYIVQRLWNFGDYNYPNNTLGGNVVNPFHEYTVSGTYTVCLKIISASGCVDSTCQMITLNIPATTCNAAFTHTFYPSDHRQVAFNSSSSTSSPGTTIINRKWTFGDGDSLMTGNMVSPVHYYNNAGTYNICLKIVTSGGCEKTICKTVVVTQSCEAKFTFTTGTSTPNGSQINFNSSTSRGDTMITTRTWIFGDGTSLQGNTVSPIHTYTQPGTYTACLIIGTPTGCGDSICKTIIVQQTQNCTAAFTYSPVSGPTGAIKFNSSNSAANTGSVIITRTWYFGDGDSLAGNVIEPTHQYTTAGIYNVCLKIRTSSGCINTVCKTVTISNTFPQCHSRFTFNTGAPTTAGLPVYFNSNTSEAVFGDTIRERIWQFGDGTSNAGNAISPTHLYTVAGVYNVCLIIRTYGGCSDTLCKTIQVVSPIPVFCRANFTYVPSFNSVAFQSISSTVSAGDSIISRTWNFGDSVTLTGNNVNPAHQYNRTGLFHVCLTIVTAKGCRSTICKDVVIANNTVQCISRFTYSKLAPKQVLFNSTNSWTPVNDSIVERKWTFGDRGIMYGNVVSPVKTYLNKGIYNACLRIRTAKGCISEYCSTVSITDSTPTTPDSLDKVRIVSLYPNPAGAQMSVNVWSKFNNVTAELAVIDIYGTKRWSMNKTLLSGYNVTTVPTGILPSGPFTFRVTSIYGIMSKKFYKM